jgi:hypothetical protein
MALIRAMETQKAPDQRLFSDPFGRRFLPLWQRALLSPARFPPWRRSFLEQQRTSGGTGAESIGSV